MRYFMKVKRLSKKSCLCYSYPELDSGSPYYFIQEGDEFRWW